MTVLLWDGEPVLWDGQVVHWGLPAVTDPEFGVLDPDLILTRSHTLAVRAEILHSGSSTGVMLRVTDGSVTADATASTRRRCDLSIVDTTWMRTPTPPAEPDPDYDLLPRGELVPVSASDLLAPFGTEVRLWRGVRLRDGSETLWPQGVFRFDDVTIARDGLLAIDGYDRSQRIRDNRWDEPYVSTDPEVPVSDVIADIITSRDPQAAFGSWHEPGDLAPDLLILDGDPWDDATELAATIGADLFCDRLGRYTLRPVPDVDSDPIAAHHVEGPGCQMTDLDRTYSARTSDGQRVPSVVQVIAEGSHLLEPILAEYVDEDPQSPTYVDGPYGRVVRQVEQTSVISEEQAAVAAEAEFRRYQGGTEQVRLSVVPDPRRDVSEVLQVTETLTRTDARFVTDRMSLPLGYVGRQEFDTRKRRV